MAPPDDGTLAEWGTQMHLAKEDPTKAADPWLTWMEPHRDRLWPAGLGRHEVSWAYCCRTGAIDVMDGDGDKDEWKDAQGPTTVTGTTDWWGQLPAGEPWVDDLKTGWVQPGLTTAQMLMYLLVAVRSTGATHGRVSVTHWRRGELQPERRWQQIGPATLDNFETELRLAWQKAAAGPSPRPGSWCRYCPSATICPAVTGKDTE